MSDFGCRKEKKMVILKTLEGKAHKINVQKEIR